MQCNLCAKFFERFTCAAPNECDCPRCQGLCNCQPWDEIEEFEDENTFRIVFHGDRESYYSEIYGKRLEQTTEEAARAICEQFDWIRNPPAR